MKMDKKDSFGLSQSGSELVKKFRLKNELTQRELAEMAGIPPATIGFIETGRVGSSCHLPKLAELMGCTVDLLGKGPKAAPGPVRKYKRRKEVHDKKVKRKKKEEKEALSKVLEFGDRVKILRKRLCMTEKSLGARVGVRAGTIKKAEKGDCTVSLAYKLSEALGARLGELMGDFGKTIPEVKPEVKPERSGAHVEVAGVQITILPIKK